MRLEIEIECQVMRHILTALRVIYVDVRWYKRNIDCDIFLCLLKESIYLLQFKIKKINYLQILALHVANKKE